MPDDPASLRAFCAAIDAWLDPVVQATGLLVHWFAGPIRFLEHPRSVRCDLDASATESLERLAAANHEDLARSGNRFPDSHDADQVVHQLHGLIHALQAARHLRNWNGPDVPPDGFQLEASRAIEHFEQAWRVESHTPLPPAKPFAEGNFEHAPPSTPTLRAFQQLLLSGRFELPRQHAWLTVQRIVSYVLGQDTPVDFTTLGPVLLAGRGVQGAVGDLTIERTWEGQLGFYLDTCPKASSRLTARWAAVCNWPGSYVAGSSNWGETRMKPDLPLRCAWR